MSLFKKKKGEADETPIPQEETEAPQEPEEQVPEQPAETEKEIPETEAAAEPDPEPATEPDAEPQPLGAAIPQEKEEDEDEMSEYRALRQRGVRYKSASWMKQMMSVARLEMRLSLKTFAPVVLFLGLGVMYLLSSQGYIDRLLDSIALGPIFFNMTGAGYAAMLLFLFPAILLYHVSRTAKIIPRDFKENVAFINYTQPVSRSAYFMGKMLAGYVPTAVMIVTSFCLAAILAQKVGGVQTSILLRSIGLALLGALALTATVFYWSSGKSKSGTLLPLMRLFIMVPLLYLLFTNIPTVLSMFPSIEPDMIDQIDEAVKGIAVYLFYLPQFTGDLSLLWMDGSGVSLSFIGIYDGLSVNLQMNHMFYGAASGLNRLFVPVVYAVWTVLFTIRGLHRFSRREL